MGILAVNLKHYIQRRGLWFQYVGLLYLFVIVMVAIFTYDKLKFFHSYVVFTFMVGTVVGYMQKETISKPFTFCMPGHREVSRKLVFIIGSVISILLSIIYIVHPKVTFPYSLLVIVAGSSFAMMMYIFGIVPTMIRQEKKIVSCVPIIMFVIIFIGLSKPIDSAIVSSPVIVILSGIIVCVIFWLRLGSASFVRENCGKFVFGMVDVFNSTKLRQFREEVLTATLGRGIGGFVRLEGYFLGKMAKCDFNSMGRFIWGNVYSVLGRLLGGMRLRQFAVLPFLVLAFGYYRQDDGFNMLSYFILLPAVATVHINLNSYPTMLVPGGRREMFWGTVVAGIAIAGLTFLFVSCLAVMSICFESFLPSFTIKGYVFDYRAMNAYKLPLVLMVVPFALSVGMLFPKNIIARLGLAIIIIIPLWALVEFFPGFGLSGAVTVIINSLCAAVLIAGAWLFYLWSIDRYFRRGQLV